MVISIKCKINVLFLNSVVFLATGFSLPAIAMEPRTGVLRPSVAGSPSPAVSEEIRAGFGQTFKQKLESKKTDSRSTASRREPPRHLFTESRNSFTRSQSTAGIQQQESKSGSSAGKPQDSKPKPYPTEWSQKVTTVDKMRPREAAKLIADMAGDFLRNPNRVPLKDVEGWMAGATKISVPFNAMDLNQSLGALAKFKKKRGSNFSGFDLSEDFKRAWLDKALEILHQFEARQIANSIHSMATLKWDVGDNFRKAFLEQAIGRLGEFNSQELSNSLWSMAKLRWDPGDVFKKKFLSVATANERLGEFNSQDLSNTLWSMATLGWDPGAQFKEKFLAAAKGGLGQFNIQDLSNTAWGLAVLSSLQKDSKESLDGIRIFLNQLKEKREDQTLELLQLHQLYLAKQWARMLEAQEGSLEDEDSKSQDEIRKFRERGSQRSKLEKKVEPHLRKLFGERLQVSFFSEVTGSQVDYVVDDVLWLIDGPSHFVRDEKGDERRTGGNHLLDALWKFSGLTPIRLSYCQLGLIEEETQQELRDKKYKDLLVQTLKDHGRLDLLDPKTKAQSAGEISSESSVQQEQKREIREIQPVARATDRSSDSRVPTPHLGGAQVRKSKLNPAAAEFMPGGF